MHHIISFVDRPTDLQSQCLDRHLALKWEKVWCHAKGPPTKENGRVWLIGLGHSLSTMWTSQKVISRNLPLCAIRKYYREQKRCYGSHSIVSCAHKGIHRVLLSARMANGRVGLMILHFEMCLFKEGNCMAIFFCQAQLVAGLAGL